MTADETNERRLTRLADHDDIRQVIYRYCRGIDRRQFDLVRDCYHEDGTDDHGNYRGGIDGFIEFVTKELAVWELTTHFIGNLLIECDGDGDSARAESYAVATHRLAARVDRPAKDFVAGVRYVDDFERRAASGRSPLACASSIGPGPTPSRPTAGPDRTRTPSPVTIATTRCLPRVCATCRTAFPNRRANS